MNDTEQVLWQRYIDARNELVVHYLPLIKFWVEKIAGKASWASKNDLSQEAVKGIIEAIGKFDLSKGVEFRTYARHYICRAIIASPELTRNIVPHSYKNYRKVKAAHDRLMKRLGRKPTIEDIAGEANLTVKQVEKALDALSIAFALEVPEAQSQEGADTVERMDIKLMIDQAFTHLGPREAMILSDYYFFDLQDKEIADKLGLKPATVKKARQRALRKLYHLLKAELPQEDLTTRKG